MSRRNKKLDELEKKIREGKVSLRDPETGEEIPLSRTTTSANVRFALFYLMLILGGCFLWNGLTSLPPAPTPADAIYDSMRKIFLGMFMVYVATNACIAIVWAWHHRTRRDDDADESS